MATEPTFTTSDDGRQLESSVTFNADAPLTLSASNASGSVSVSTDPLLPAGTIRVVATRTDNDRFEEDDHHFNVKVDGNTISVHPDWQFASGVSGLARRIRDQLQHGFRPEDWNLSRLKLSPELDFNIVVSLPAPLAQGSQVKIRTASGEVSARELVANTSIVTASGDVDAGNLTGTVAIHTASGDVQATDISESLEVNTASGDVSISGGDAWLAARSASGDVSIRGMQLRNSRITTVSGDAQIYAILNNTASYGIETVSGDVSLDVTLPGEGARATLGFGTLSGSSNVGPVWDKQKRREWTAGAGESGPTINVKTVSGDLSASARLDLGVHPRALAMPRPEMSAEDDDMDDFKREMKQFGKEMKHLGREMKHMGRSMSHELHPTEPIPPVPPAPPAQPRPAMPPMPPAGDEEGMRAYEEAMRDYEERVRQIELDNEQRLRDHEQRLRDREQRLRDREQQRLERHLSHEQRRADRQERREERREEREARRGGPDASIFTAGPSGVDYRRDAESAAATGQPTEPVAPPAQFTEEHPVTDTQQGTAQESAARTDQPASEQTDPRLRVLEALEKGEIDIEDALAQLDTHPDSDTSR